jgi:hypothetical protein
MRDISKDERAETRSPETEMADRRPGGLNRRERRALASIDRKVVEIDCKIEAIEGKRK